MAWPAGVAWIGHNHFGASAAGAGIVPPVPRHQFRAEASATCRAARVTSHFNFNKMPFHLGMTTPFHPPRPIQRPL